jgi:hypothetical protein
VRKAAMQHYVSPKNTKGALFSAPSIEFFSFLTLYIQNSILQRVIGTFFQVYFRRLFNQLREKSRFTPLDKIF